AQRCRTEPAEQVGRPAAEHLRDVDAAAYADVKAHAARVRADRELIAGLRLERAALVGAGERDDRRGEKAQTRAGERALDGRCTVRVADEAVPPLERAAVGGARRRDAEVGEAGTPAVLHRRERPGVDHLDRGHRKRTRSPARSSAGCSRPASKSTASVRPSRRQPPGDSRGYTPEYGPAIATVPPGTRVRGSDRRGTTSRSSRPSR